MYDDQCSLVHSKSIEPIMYVCVGTISYENVYIFIHSVNWIHVWSINTHTNIYEIFVSFISLSVCLSLFKSLGMCVYASFFLSFCSLSLSLAHTLCVASVFKTIRIYQLLHAMCGGDSKPFLFFSFRFDFVDCKKRFSSHPLIAKGTPIASIDSLYQLHRIYGVWFCARFS